MIGPVQERMPIYIAAIGPKNTQLTGEIADGWLPTFFSPEHVGESRKLLEEGAARAGNGKAIDDSFDIAPNVNLCIDDDIDARARLGAADPRAVRRRHGLARQELLQPARAAVRVRGAAKEVQDLYLDGKKDEAAAALPAELIDTVSLVGPKERVRERLAAYRDAGVGTLMLTPMAFTAEGRSRMMRELAEMAA